MKKFLDDLRKETLEQKWNYYRVPLYVSNTPLRVLNYVGEVVCTPRVFKAKEAMTGDKIILVYDEQCLDYRTDSSILLSYDAKKIGELHDSLLMENGFVVFVRESDFDEEHKITNQEMIDYCNEFENSAYNKVLSTYAKKEKGKLRIK